MALYHLEVLNDKEFEELCKDLLEKEIGLLFQIFKTGRDKGIDLRYANNYENEIIVQAKRFGRSTYSNLTTELDKELGKMHKLAKKPKQYILMTAFDLSVGQVDEVVLQMTPFVKNSQDVYGRERIMNLIAKYPEIEKKYYKLWLTSTNVLNQVLHNGVNGRSEFVKEKILKKASFYVPTRNFDLAIEKLRENHFLIISGEPGIGKTTISYLLICDLLANGYQLIYVDDQLKDAEDILNASPELKQVVFFDDFFGANLSEIMNPRNSEGKIVGFIERIQASTNKFLVMTTRTTILKQAQFRFEKFNRSGLADLSKYELEIKSYSKLDKAKILYNHMFHSGMAAEQYDVFFKSQNYLKIINHKNYFPRLIEFITSVNQLKAIPVEETEDFIFKSLNNPKEIWHFAYDQQLNEEEKFLLMTLFSLGAYNVPSDQLEKAFEARYTFEIKENGFVLKTDAYQQSLRKLLDGFIKSEKNPNDGHLTFDFLNPSIGDFVINFLGERYSETKRILYSAVYFKQITGYFTPESSNGIKLTATQLKLFYPKFNAILPNLLSSSNDEMTGNISALYILLNYFRDLVTEERLLEIITETDLSFATGVSFKELIFILNKLDEYTSTQKYIQENWEDFFSAAIEAANDSYDISKVLDLFTYYELYEEDWSANPRFMSAVQSRVNELYSSDDLDLSSKQDTIFNAYYAGYHERALDIVAEKISDDYTNFLNDCSLSNYYEQFYPQADLDTQGVLDTFIGSYNTHDDYDPGDRMVSSPSVFNEDSAIQQLFER
ncbi:MAG TPA: restriction endonuclease [Flavitalea sp.]|nr:restriction endonuclease [Flavitalea sp.]